MNKKTFALLAVVAIIVVVAAVVVWPIMASRMGNQRKSGSLLGEWTDNASTGVSTYKYGTLKRATIVGFGPKGREMIDAWVTIPHHPHPLPIASMGHYEVHGSTLVQTIPSRSNAFGSLGLQTAQTNKQTTLTSQFAIHADQLILTQSAGKSASFTLTATALPPTSPGGGGPGAGPGKGH